MKKFMSNFLLRGLVTCGFGPMILAVVYLVLQRHGVVQMLQVDEVCTGIFSLIALAFVAGGMNAIYQVEKVPLMLAILIHGGVLYVTYIVIYLVNGWLQRRLMPILVFSAIFLGGYALIWTGIYLFNKRRTAKINQNLQP